MKEVKRIPDVMEFTTCYTTKCIECGKEIDLHWNGGELDYKKCCGYVYSLEHQQVDFVIEKEGVDE